MENSSKEVRDENLDVDETEEQGLEGRFVKKSMTVENLYKKNKTFRLNFDLAIQRKENIWDVKKQSLLINTVLQNLFVPPVVAIKDGSKLNIIDGKQRLLTIFGYIGKEFALDKTTKPVHGQTIAGLLFDELPESFQKTLLNYKIDVSIGENLSVDEVDDQFFRLNSGVPLNTIEITRSLLGNKIVSFLKRITDHPFFEYKLNISASAKKRYTDQELVLQILKLIHYPDSGLSSKEMKPFIEKLKNEDLKEELKSSLDNALFYLNEAFPKKQKFLKKIHTPMLVILVLEIIHNNLTSKIPAVKFGKWATDFFAETPEAYKKACQSGSAKKESVQTRISVMKDHFNKYFADVLGFNKDNTDNENNEINETV